MLIDAHLVPVAAFGVALVVVGLYVVLSSLQRHLAEDRQEREKVERFNQMQELQLAAYKRDYKPPPRPDRFIVFDRLKRERHCSCGAGVLTVDFGRRFQCEKGHDLGKTAVFGDPMLEGPGVYLARIGRPTGRRCCESCGAPLTSRRCSYCTTENP
jgi:hypothetical protein